MRSFRALFAGFLFAAPALADEDFSPPAPDPQKFARVIDVVRDFGARGDGQSDDWEAIQKAVGLDASGACQYEQPTLVVLPPTPANTYVISQAIRFCSWVTLWVPSNATTVAFTGKAGRTDYTGAAFMNRWPTYGAVLMGNIGANLETPAFEIEGPLSPGQKAFQLQNPDDAAQIAVGDLVDVETATTFSPAGVMPTRLKMGLVNAVSARGAVELDRPMDFASDHVKLRKLTNRARSPNWPTMKNGGADTHIPIFAVHHCGLIGGRWVASGAEPQFQPLNGGGGMLECTVALDEVVAGMGVGYGNLMQTSRFSVRYEKILRTPFEMAYHSSDSTTRIGFIEVTGAVRTRPSSGWDIAFDEGSHDNRIFVERIEDQDGDVVGQWRLFGKVSPQGGEILPVKIAGPEINGGAPIEMSYQVRPGDTLASIATNVAAALNADVSFAAAGFQAAGNPPGGSGVVIVTNSRRNLAFTVSGGGAKPLGAYSPSHDIVSIVNAYNNKVEINSVAGAPITGYVVDVFSSGAPGVKPPTSGNDVSVRNSGLAYQYGYVRIAGAEAVGNVVHDGRFNGATFQNKAFWYFWDVGAKNVMRNLEGDARGDLAWSDRKGQTNLFERVGGVQ